MKSKSTVTNLAIFLNSATTLPCSQGQTTSIYFDFSNASGILPRAPLHHEFSNYGLSFGYVNWFLNYLTNSLVYVILIYFIRLLSCS
jgi:hypothetical protein